MNIDISELVIAFQYASGSGYENDAYLDKESGQVYYSFDAPEAEMPADLYENEKYVVIPDKRELGLGKSLAIRFVQKNLPSDTEKVYAFFRSKGAYANFKRLLEDRGALDKWYEYEQEAFTKAIVLWCEERDIPVSL